MECKICGSESSLIFNKRVLNKYDVDYFRCENCKFTQTEKPFWLDEAYDKSINLTDTGYMSRNLLFRNRLKYFLKFKFRSDDIFEDFGAGYGVFTRLMRDLNFDFRWSDQYTQNLFARGFEVQKEDIRFAAITLFEVAEHLVNPFEQFFELSKKTDNIIFSTEIAPKSLKKLDEWWYLGLEHGQHVGIWSKDTVNEIAIKLGMYPYTIGSLHFLTKRRLSFADKVILNFSTLFQRVENKLFGSLTWSDYLSLK